jgi:hypothetical protein
MDNYQYKKSDFLSYLVCEASTILPDKERRKFFRVYEKVQQDISQHKICFTIDEIELPVQEIFDKIEQNLDDMVTKRAIVFLKDKLEDTIQKIDDLSSVIKDAAKDIVLRIERDFNIKDFDND